MKVLAYSLLIGAMCNTTLGAPVVTAIQPLREIHLPVPASRGAFSLFPLLDDMGAKRHFAMRVAKDQSILIFDSDASGKWPLVRVKKWWGENPASEVLGIPGWSGHLEDIYVDIQVTPDGRYGVAFAEAVWNSKSKRRPDTIITVVDLERWQVVKSVHTTRGDDARVRDARVIHNEWIALDANLGLASLERGTDNWRNWTLSIPNLKPGPECASERSFEISGPVPKPSQAHQLDTQNSEACRDVFTATGTDSDRALEVTIQRGTDIEPEAMRLRDVEWLEGALEQDSHASRSEAERLWDADEDSAEFFRYWGQYPYYDQVWQNPPFESSSHLWYGLYPSKERGVYDLVRYDAAGRQQKAETASHFACGDTSIGKANADCGCRVIDASEEQLRLLTFCRKQHGDYTGMVQMEWLSVFRSDDLTGIGFINLPKKGYALQAIASGEGRAYVVTLEFGQTLRVYAVPGRPN